MAERLAALVVLVAGGVYIALALQYPRGVAARPGAGFFPIIVGVLICLAAAGFALETFRRAPARRSDDETLTHDARFRVVATSAVLAFFCLALPWIGYTAATFLFVAVMLRALGGGWTLTLATAAVSAAASYYLFAVFLAVPLPGGVWFD